MPVAERPDLVDDLMRGVRRSIDVAVNAAHSSKNTVWFAWDLVARRRQLGAIRDLLSSQQSDLRETLMTAVWVVYHEHPEALRADSRTGVVKAWTHLLIDAKEKVEHDDRWTARYANADSAGERSLVAGASGASSSALRDL